MRVRVAFVERLASMNRARVPWRNCRMLNECIISLEANAIEEWKGGEEKKEEICCLPYIYIYIYIKEGKKKKKKRD